MNSNDEPKFAGMLAALGGCFDKEVGDAMIAGYWMALKDLPLESVAKAFERAVQELEFFPKPVAIRRLCGEMRGEDRAIAAWAAVRSAIGNHGVYRSIDFDDPLINATIRNLGGWEKLCMTPAEEFAVWTKKDFERTYNSLMQSPALSSEAIAALPGRHERENEGKHAIEPPRRIAVGLPPHRAGLLPAPADESKRIEGNVNKTVLELAAKLGGSSLRGG